MKTQSHHTDRPGLQRRRQSLLVIAGVAVAVLCALVLLREIGPAPVEPVDSGVASVVVGIAQRVIEVADVSVLKLWVVGR